LDLPLLEEEEAEDQVQVVMEHQFLVDQAEVVKIIIRL
jgi:hypothetical protein